MKTDLRAVNLKVMADSWDAETVQSLREIAGETSGGEAAALFALCDLAQDVNQVAPALASKITAQLSILCPAYRDRMRQRSAPDTDGFYFVDQVPSAGWCVFANDDRRGWFYNFGHGDEGEVRARSVARELNRERDKLQSQAAPAGVVVERVRIEKPDGLDPITVYLEDYGNGQGRAVIVCYSSAWTCYWGSMGRPLREFIAGCDEHYVGGCMTSMSYHRVTKSEQGYANRVARAVIDEIRGHKSAKDA